MNLFGEIRSALHATGVDAEMLSSLLHRVEADDRVWMYVREALARRDDGERRWVWSSQALDQEHGVLLLYDHQVFSWALPCDSIHSEPSRALETLTHLTRVRRWGRVTLIDAGFEAEDALRSAACLMCLRWLDHLGVHTPTVRRALRTRLAHCQGRESRTKARKGYAAFQEFWSSIPETFRLANNKVLQVVDEVLSSSSHRAVWRVLKAMSTPEMERESMVTNVVVAHGLYVEHLGAWERRALSSPRSR